MAVRDEEKMNPNFLKMLQFEYRWTGVKRSVGSLGSKPRQHSENQTETEYDQL